MPSALQNRAMRGHRHRGRECRGAACQHPPPLVRSTGRTPMKPDHRIESRPVADAAAVVQGDRYRITVLADGLLRLEYSDDGVFEDRASSFALYRDLPVPGFRVIDLSLIHI